MDNNNFQGTNYENQNIRTETQPDIEMPSQTSQPKQKNKLMIPFIILLILTVGGLTFGIFEFMQNSNLKSEIADLKSKIETPEKPDEPKEEKHNIYSGTLEYSFSTYGNENDGPVASDTPQQKYTVNLNFDTGELYVKHESIGNCPGANCGESEETLSLTEKELKKIWWVIQSENYEDVDVDLYFSAPLTTKGGHNLKSILVNIVKDSAVLAKKDEVEKDEWEEMSEYDVYENDEITFREFANIAIDNILFGIYGWLNCVPSADFEPEANCLGAEGANCSADGKVTDCIDADGTDCKFEEAETTKPVFSCSNAEDIDYPYIAY